MLVPSTPQSAPGVADGHIGRIPVRNLWLLMLYASDLFRMQGVGKVGSEDAPDELPDVIAKILVHTVQQRHRRRLSPGYRLREGVLGRVRGRIDVLETTRHQLLARGLIACRFEELTIDTPRNRLVRAALEAMGRIVRCKDLGHNCRLLAAAMQSQGVLGAAPTRAEASAERFGRHDAEDRFMVAAARLALDLALPTEAAGTKMLALPDRDVVWVRRLFERAVGGFYDVVLRPHGWEVRRGGKLEWQITRKTADIDRILPAMQTDIVLNHEATGRRIVIDTKFTSIVTRGWHREETLRSGHLYQIYAYLRSQAGRGDALADSATGVLLHPSVGHDLDQSVDIQGHTIRFATINLAGSAANLRSDLLRLLETSMDIRHQHDG